jgi:hypothetical protein
MFSFEQLREEKKTPSRLFKNAIKEVKRRKTFTKNEIWKDIPNFEGKYQASNMGRIKSLKRFCKSSLSKKGMRIVPELILKQSKDGKYKSVSLHTSPNGRRDCQVHVLILEAFIGPRPTGMQCRHLDGNPSNNKLSNLKWGTPKQNAEDRIKHGTAPRGENVKISKLTDKKVMRIKKLYNTGKYTKTKLAHIFNVSRPLIAMVIKGKIWKHV